ncbi:Uma2 family endonuclease [Benzoatithermus flavus]|uniref:Uma2 family endonuclease n=1 Tax=Benzoatithermus flavus TaxID=3108223 RepID=A0ABU8XNN3_9PROT
MALPAEKLGRTPAEWRAWEEKQPERWELVGDEPTLMAGGTPRHNDITINIVTAFRRMLRGSPCRAYTSDVKTIHPSGRWVYPDAVVRYGERLDREAGIEDAVLAVEVLSPGTESHDTQNKRWFYVEMPTLRHVLYVAQDRPRVELYSRGENGTWQSRSLSGLEAVVRIDTLGLELPLAEIYDEIPFPSPAEASAAQAQVEAASDSSTMAAKP